MRAAQVSVVLETASSNNEMVRSSAPLAIGFAVFCAHAVSVAAAAAVGFPVMSVRLACPGAFSAQQWNGMECMQPSCLFLA